MQVLWRWKKSSEFVSLNVLCSSLIPCLAISLSGDTIHPIWNHLHVPKRPSLAHFAAPPAFRTRLAWNRTTCHDMRVVLTSKQSPSSKHVAPCGTGFGAATGLADAKPKRATKILRAGMVSFMMIVSRSDYGFGLGATVLMLTSTPSLSSTYTSSASCFNTWRYAFSDVLNR